MNGILFFFTSPKMDTDLRRLLCSNSAPSELEETVVLHNITLLDGSIAQVDLKLSMARRVLQDLSSQKSLLRVTKEAYVSILSAHRRLPSDLWIEIMKFAVWSSSTPPKPHRYGHYSSN